MSEVALLRNKCESYLRSLCVDIKERSVGSDGNRTSTRFVNDQFVSLGWTTETPEFDAIDWHDGGATLHADGSSFKVLVSPYSLGCDVASELVSASDITGLEALDCSGRVLLLHGEIAREQLMPKNFVFYNPEEHQRIVARLEQCGARALVSATGRNAALAGGVYPFPLIEDGDFDVPSVYMTEEEGARLLPFVGTTVHLHSVSERIPGKAYNVIARRGRATADRIVITAHIDAKKGTPGAIDNATGVAVLLLCAQLLHDYRGPRQIEIVAFNGEDYYAVPGQMNYIGANRDAFETILVNINIDGAGYREGPSALSFYGVSEQVRRAADGVLQDHHGVVEGPQWPQGDHSIFVQYGRPAIAASSKWFTDNINDQSVTHTPSDSLDIVDVDRVVELAVAIADLVRRL